jgi:hypothetical protein
MSDWIKRAVSGCRGIGRPELLPDLFGALTELVAAWIEGKRAVSEESTEAQQVMDCLDALDVGQDVDEEQN